MSSTKNTWELLPFAEADLIVGVPKNSFVTMLSGFQTRGSGEKIPKVKKVDG